MNRYFRILMSFVPSVFFIHQVVNCRQSRAQFRTLAWANGINFDGFLLILFTNRACIGEAVAKMVAFMFVGNFFFSYEVNCFDLDKNRRKIVSILGVFSFYERAKKSEVCERTNFLPRRFFNICSTTQFQLTHCIEDLF